MAVIGHKRVPFDNLGYFVIGIFVVALFGFVPSYFPEFSGRQVEFSVYTHFHAVSMVLWLGVLITQPFLIRNRLNSWHRILGRISYVQVPLLMLASLLLVHSRLDASSERPLAAQFWVPFKDLIVIGTTYGLAIYYRRNVAYHARLMAGSCFQLLEPGLARALMVFSPLPNLTGVLVTTYLVIDGCLVYLVVRDRKRARGKWIFRMVFGMTVCVQALVFLLQGGMEVAWFTAFVAWFAGLKIT